MTFTQLFANYQWSNSVGAVVFPFWKVDWWGYFGFFKWVVMGNSYFSVNPIAFLRKDSDWLDIKLKIFFMNMWHTAINIGIDCFQMVKQFVDAVPNFSKLLGFYNFDSLRSNL